MMERETEGKGEREEAKRGKRVQPVYGKLKQVAQPEDSQRKQALAEISVTEQVSLIESPQVLGAQRAKAMLNLQQSYGNRYVQRVMGKVQAKLMVNPPDDQYESEADRVADVVTRASSPSIQRQATELEEKEEGEEVQTKISQIQRQAEEEEAEEEEEEEEEEEPIQTRKAGEQTPLISSSLQSRINSLKGGGQPLPESTRKYFEPRFGSSFNNVRIHNNSQAANIAKSINAKAFTTERDIVFGAGQYSPETSGGKHLLAHELTHVVQQQAAPALQRQAAVKTPKAGTETPNEPAKEAIKALWDVAVTNNVSEAYTVMSGSGRVRVKAAKASDLLLKSSEAIHSIRYSYESDPQTFGMINWAHSRLETIRVGLNAYTKEQMSVKKLTNLLSPKGGTFSIFSKIKERL